MLYIGKFILLISTEALSRYRVLTRVAGLQPVLWIRNFCLDPDPELKFRIQIQQKVKEHINKTVKL